MTEYDDTNSGTLFKNDRKTTDAQPDYRGSINVGGIDFWISAWIKTAGENSKNPGMKFMSLAVTEKQEEPMSQPADDEEEPADFDDDVPF